MNTPDGSSSLDGYEVVRTRMERFGKSLPLSAVPANAHGGAGAGLEGLVGASLV